MLSEDSIDNLVQPIVDRQESINTFVLSTMASKVREIGTISASDIKKLNSLTVMGTDIRLMNKELARMSGLQVRDIKSVIKTVALEANLDAKPLYDYRHKSFIPYTENTKLQDITHAIADRTADTYSNISNSKATGFLIRDMKHPGILKFQSIGDTYKSVIDEAVQAVKSGVDFRVAMRRTLRQLSASGIRRLYWESGYTQRLDTAVRRNILEGVRAIDQAIADELGNQLGATGKELSVHMNSALDHEPFQGHQFTNIEWEKLQNSEDFEDIDGEQFIGVERVIGMWNCRHVAKSIFVGITKPKYTKAELQKFIEKNHKGYTLPNGKHLTMYECTQMQRQFETRIRYAKDEQLLMQKVGDMQAAKIARAKVVRLTQEYKKFSNDCGLKIHKDRMAVAGYNRI